jgi:hypothetical protein
MKRLLGCVGMLTVASALVSAEPLKSGPQAGEDLPGPFHPLNVNGANAGEQVCLFCHFGSRPVAMVFARQATPELAKLARKLDEATESNRPAELGGCVILCSDDGTLKTKLEDVAKKERLKNVILAIENPAGPKDYNIAKSADVTVLLYTDRTVKANHAFRAGELNDKAIEKVLSDLGKILPEKK